MTTCAGPWTAVGIVVTKDFHMLCTGNPQRAQAARAERGRTCEHALPTVGGRRDTWTQETTNASRPRVNGAGTPTRGLADRMETTDS